MSLSVSSTQSTRANYAGTNLPTILASTKAPTGRVAYDTGRIGLIDAINFLIESGSAIGAFFGSIPLQGPSQNDVTTSLLQRAGFSVAGLTQQQIKFLGDRLKVELTTNRMQERADAIQKNSKKKMSSDELGVAALKQALKEAANGSNPKISLQDENNTVAVKPGKNESRSGCVVEQTVYLLEDVFYVKTIGTLFGKDGKPEPRGKVTVKITARANGRMFRPKDELIPDGVLTGGGGRVVVPPGPHEYYKVPAANGMARRQNISIESKATCVMPDGNNSGAQSPVYKEPGYQEPKKP